MYSSTMFKAKKGLSDFDVTLNRYRLLEKQYPDDFKITRVEEEHEFGIKRIEYLDVGLEGYHIFDLRTGREISAG